MIKIMVDLISVIIPVYNVEPYLKKCLDSVVAQTYKEIEIILVDDGSTDGSGLICDEYAARDKRIKVIHKQNGGLSDARNVGLERCGGRYVTFIDSDDYVANATNTTIAITVLLLSLVSVLCPRNHNADLTTHNISLTIILLHQFRKYGWVRMPIK